MVNAAIKAFSMAKTHARRIWNFTARLPALLLFLQFIDIKEIIWSHLCDSNAGPVLYEGKLESRWLVPVPV